MILPPKYLIEAFKNTKGAMSVAEGVALYSLALQAPEGNWMELGSHRGKSSMMIAYAIKSNSYLSLLEPDFSDKKIMGEVGIRLALIDKKEVVNTTIDLVADYSTNVLPEYKNMLSFLFVDSGDHGEELVQTEKVLYEDKLVSGGIIAFHDINSQFTAVTRCYEQLIESGKYEAIAIHWQEIFDYVKENNLEEGNDSWHQYPDLGHPPNFIGAVRRK